MHQSETLYTGARFTTLDPETPYATALLVRGERIVAVGDIDECRLRAAPGVQEVDLDGGHAVPGLTDCHVHLAGYAHSKRWLDVRGAEDLLEAQRILAAYAATLPDGAWVFGHYDAHQWRLGREVHRTDLDTHAGGRPVVFQSHDTHTAWVNTAALRELGIDDHTASPAGGRIERDDHGPTGVLRETAGARARELVYEQDHDPRRLLADAFTDLLAHGITSVHDIDGRDTGAAYQALRRDGALPVRVHQLISRDGLRTAIDAGEATGDGDSWLRIGPVKLFADGALGSRTAALSSPYSDDAGNTGVQVTKPDELRELATTAATAGIAIAVHAIGDAANTTVLDTIAEVRRRGLAPRLRHRIEHAQHVAWHDVARFGALGVVASMQPIHCTSDIPLTRSLLGDRRLASYAWADLAAAGAHVAFGSDGPVESIDPVAGIRAATTRVDTATGESDADSSNTVPPSQALRAYTTEAAYASYEEHDKGRLAPGFLADFAVFDDDLADRGVAASGTARATCTVVGGRVRWQRSP